MPDAALVAEYRRVRDDYSRAGQELEPLVIRMALDRTAELVMGACALEVHGRVNEDWIPVLRIQRVLDEHGAVLVDIEVGHDDPVVEEGIDEVGTEYLDLLLDLTGDDYMGDRTIDRSDIDSA
jgi:hypothetical protein